MSKEKLKTSFAKIKEKIQKKPIIAVLAVLCVFLLAVIVSALTGKPQEPEISPEIIAEEQIFLPEPKPEPEPTPKPQTKPGELILPPEIIEAEEESDINYLTGLPIDAALVDNRPFAVTINNMHRALPQSGIRQADIYYEALAEGDITRFVLLFMEFDSEKIGPVRSTRDYYGAIALDNDAIYFHHGGSPGGYTFARTYLDAVDGMRDTQCYWRDPERYAIKSMIEHSSYTSAERIKDAVLRNEFRTKRGDPPYVRFDFYENPATPEDSEKAESITVPFSGSQSPRFEYDEELNVYWRFQAGGEHIDEETDEQISVTNIIIQLASISVIDTQGRRQVDLVSNGAGYIITNGHIAPITWEKTGLDSPTEFFDAAGEPLKLNKGKTWICILQNTGVIKINE